MIHLYAEHLLNIRTLSIQASLSTVSSRETKATLSADGNILTLLHDGERASITLPVTLPGDHSDATLTIPAAPTKDLSFRLQVQEKQGSTGLLSNGQADDGVIDPWTAGSLTPTTEVNCAKCNTTFIPRGRIQQWKDLPSEGWAEMMDFWHCHKPDVPHDHDQDNTAGHNKAYSASGKLAIESGVGLVGALDFVFAAEDMQNVEVRSCLISRNISPLLRPCSPLRTTRGRSKEPALSGRKVTFGESVGIQAPEIKPL